MAQILRLGKTELNMMTQSSNAQCTEYGEFRAFGDETETMEHFLCNTSHFHEDTINDLHLCQLEYAMNIATIYRSKVDLMSVALELGNQQMIRFSR